MSGELQSFTDDLHSNGSFLRGYGNGNPERQHTFDPTEPIILSCRQQPSRDNTQETSSANPTRRVVLGVLAAGFGIVTVLGNNRELSPKNNAPIVHNSSEKDIAQEAEKLLWDATFSTVRTIRAFMGDRLPQKFVLKEKYYITPDEKVDVRRKEKGINNIEWGASVIATASTVPNNQYSPVYGLSFYVKGIDEKQIDSIPDRSLMLVVGGRNEILESKLRAGTLTAKEIIDCIGADGANGGLDVIRTYAWEDRSEGQQANGQKAKQSSFARADDGTRQLFVEFTDDYYSSTEQNAYAPGDEAYWETATLAHDHLVRQNAAFKKIAGIR